MLPGEVKDSRLKLERRERLCSAFFNIDPEARGWGALVKLNWGIVAPHKNSPENPSPVDGVTPVPRNVTVDVESFRAFLRDEIIKLDAELHQLGVDVSVLCQPVGYKLRSLR